MKTLGGVRHWALSDQGQSNGLALNFFFNVLQCKLQSAISQFWNMIGSCY